MNTMDGKNNGMQLLEPASPESLVPDYGLWPWLLAAAIAVLLIAALLLILRKRKTTTVDPAAIRNAAFAEAIAALANQTAGDTRDAAVQCSLILRRYLSAAAADPALFETHEEFISRHDALQALTPQARAATETGFTRLAALKYAPEIPAAAPADVITDSRSLLETLHHGFAA